MSDYIFSEHAFDMLQERNIKEKWLQLALTDPDWIEKGSNNTVHHIKCIKEYNNRYLRVVTNPANSPIKIVTLYFDRRIKRK